MIRLLLLLIPFLSFANDWGKTGHRIVGQIAQDHLTPKALATITELLDGETLATVSTWADEMRSNPDFRPYDKWHYVNLPEDKKYHEVEHTQDNAVIIIFRAIDKLCDETVSKEEKTFYLKYLVHLVGDIHQPLHTGRAADYGGSTIKLYFGGRKSNQSATNLHRLWDTNMIDDFKMSYTEFSDYLQSYKTPDFPQGDAVCWANESHEIVNKVYAEVKYGDELSYPYLFNNFYIVKQRLYQAGIRLANILNQIYG